MNCGNNLKQCINFLWFKKYLKEFKILNCTVLLNGTIYLIQWTYYNTCKAWKKIIIIITVLVL